ncbi:phage tail protein [Priestia flexa]|uniref:phage tail protein n=1 Tax=Priestia flexa TaxID=86664 RepID=UPI00248F524C|nr:phage tail protein [Priestia flexa]
METMFIEDLQGEQYPLQAAVDRERGINGEKSISLTLYEEKWNEDYFKNIDTCWKLGFDGDEYEVVIPRAKARGKKAVWELKAVHRFFVDMRNSWKYETHTGSMTIQARMNFVFNGSGYNFVIVDSFGAKEMENFGDSSRLDLFQKILETYEAEFEIVGNTVYIRTQIGQDTDFVYHRNLNLKDITIEKDSTNFSTYGEGFGKDGLHVTYTSPLASIPGIGIRHAPPVRDERYTVESSLFNTVKKSIDESLVVSITVDVAELRAQGYQSAPNEGDRIFLMDDRLNLDIETRIVNISESFNVKGELISQKVTISNKSIRESYQSQLSNAVKQIQDIQSGRGKIPYNVLPEAIKLATSALQSAQTELVFENGIVAVDKNNPNLVVVLNSAGFGISTDGGQTFENAITALGVNTNLLTAGAIHTNNIQIIGTESYFFWDGNEFLAMDPNDQNKFVKIMPGLIDISGGAIRIRRPDGAYVMINGLLQYDFSIKGAEPTFTGGGATVDGRFFTTTVRDVGVADCQAYFFQHRARYLRVNVAMYVTVGATAYMSIERGYPANGNHQILATVSSSNLDPREGGAEMLIDLGVPTSQKRLIYLRLRSSNGQPVWGREVGIWQED